MLKKLRLFKDKLRFAKNKFLYDFKASAELSSFNFESIKHIVVSKMDGKLGDSQVITPFFTQIRQHFPSIKFSVLCSENIAPIYLQCLNIDRVVILPKKPQKNDIKNAVKKIMNLGPCDLLITTEPNFRARDFILESLLKPTYTAGFEGRADCVNINLLKRNLGKHISEYFKDLLILGGIKTPDMHYLPLTTKESSEKLAFLFNGKTVYGIAPYGASKHRKLSDKTIIDICDFFLNFDANAYLCPLVAPQDRFILETLKNKYNERLIVLPEELNATDLAYAISRLKFLLSVDTANVHLACASNTSLFALYSGIDPDGIIRWGPAPWCKNAETFYKEKTLIENLDFEDFAQQLHNFIQIED